MPFPTELIANISLPNDWKHNGDKPSVTILPEPNAPTEYLQKEEHLLRAGAQIDEDTCAVVSSGRAVGAAASAPLKVLTSAVVDKGNA